MGDATGRTMSAVEELQQTSARRKSAPTLTLLRCAALVLVYNEILGGVIRYALVRIGMAWLAYTPMVMALGAVAYCCVALPYRRKVWAALAMFGAYTVYSALMAANRPGMGAGKAAACVGFAVYTWTPLLVGLLLAANGQESVIERFAPIFWGLAISGVILDNFVGFPWMGSTFEIAGQEISVAKSWSANGITRLAGFARASFGAGHEIATFSAVLIVRSALRLRWRALIWAVSIIGIGLTTSKGPLMVPLVTACALLLIYAARALHIAQLSRWIAMSTLWLLMTATVALPLLLGPKEASIGSSSIAPMPDALRFVSLSSMGERAQQMWPEAFDLIKDDRNWSEWIFGRGLGGIGAAQYFFEHSKANAADNMFVYAYVTLGVGCVFILLPMLAGLGRYYSRDPEKFFLFFALGVSVLTLAISSSVLEATLPGLCAGVLLGRWLAEDPGRSHNGLSLLPAERL